MFETSFVPTPAAKRPPRHWFIGLMFGLTLVMLGHLLYDGWLGGQVASRQPIGKALSVTGEGRKTLVETATGYYPLSKTLVVEKGTPLELEIHRNGDRYVCSAAGTVCSGTAKRGFEHK